MKTFKALSALLTYPSAELQAGDPRRSARCCGSRGCAPGAPSALEPLLVSLEQATSTISRSATCLLFDRSRTLSLNLFEHVHGESRDRGGAMVDLLETYRAGGFDLVGPELPDHLPVLLEFLSTRPQAEAREILDDAGAILVALAERLARRESPYAAVLEALVAFRRGRSADRGGQGPAGASAGRPRGSGRPRCGLGGGAGHLRP